MNPSGGGWVILLTLVVAMVLSVAHLPESWPAWLAWLRPSWLVMVVFFWVIELPHRLGLIAMWLLGCLVDVLLAQPLGVNGVVLAGTTYVAWRFFERLRMYSVIQQAGMIFILVLGAEVVRSLALIVSSQHQFSFMILLTALVSAVLWPFAYLPLMRLRTALRIE